MAALQKQIASKQNEVNETKKTEQAAREAEEAERKRGDAEAVIIILNIIYNILNFRYIPLFSLYFLIHFQIFFLILPNLYFF